MPTNAEMILVTEQSDPKKYMMIVGSDESLFKADVTLTFPQGTRFVNVPEGTAGMHTLTGRRFAGSSVWGIRSEDYRTGE